MKTLSKVGLTLGVITGAGLLASQTPLAKKIPTPYNPIKTANGTTTVAQTKTNEELATTVIGLYGSQHLKGSPWNKTEATLKTGLTVVKNPTSTQSMSYALQIKDTAKKDAPYYRLVGPDHNQVNYYDGQSAQPKKTVPLAKVVDDTNHRYSNQQQNYFATRVKIRYAQ
ncbi:hypothetical protein JOC36_001198 [Weissella uvarum]|uniref:hypothetical protein n=1 Tax=Weissella uvarum TaxID=1479233 RepID=UPI0019618CF9|nr:hypothetical protein [Weissella uvarum]MBM7617636.1 hypothetical protein [Weissella uvarum]MCM0595985.1 hypothetical protein [Weissella uvarum]